MRSGKPLAVIATFILVAAATAGSARADDDAPPRTITLTGQGEVSARPDTASVAAGVVTEAADARSAVRHNTAAVTGLFKALRDFGVAPRDMQTRGYTVSPSYTRPQPGQPPAIQGYRVSNTIAVRVRDLSKLGDLLDRMVSAGANQMNGVRFYIEDSEKLTDRARIAAVKDARRKAGLYAEAAGVHVGHVISIRETGAERPRPILRAMVQAAPANGVPVAAGEETVRVSVSVTYAIER